VTIAFLGALFAVWARVTLGTNWSGTVATVKKDHELVQSGPYALARHPIYTGFLITMVGTALTVGTVASVIICAVAFFLRIQLEETVMTKHFPKEYPAYKKRTKALIPLVW
jgi:protein-S-isoprenylcysteine O-methyltransferase Ste14